MTVNKILSDIRKELKKNVDPLYKKGSLNFFKEKVLLYGVRSPQLKKIESSFWQRVKILNKKDFIKLTEVLFKSNLNEEFSLGCGWLNRRIDEKVDRRDILCILYSSDKWRLEEAKDTLKNLPIYKIVS